MTGLCAATLVAALIYAGLGKAPPGLTAEVQIGTAPPRATAAAPPSSELPPGAAPAQPAAPAPNASPAQTATLAALTATADPALIEPGPAGPLPVVGSDGRRPWQAYARAFDRGDLRPRVGLVVTGLGLAAEPTNAAVELPGAVTLSFSPYAQLLPQWIQQARSHGHEVLLDLPMEPADYPRDDPGPYTLLTGLDPKSNRDRLEALLGRAAGYVGLAAVKGTRFLGAVNDLRPVLETLQRRGLLFVDNGAAPQSASVRLAAAIGLPIAVATPPVDAGDAGRAEIDRRLADLEDAAKRNRTALALAGAVPLTIERVGAWASGLDDRKVALAPVSALVQAAPPADRREAAPPPGRHEAQQ